MLFYVFVYLLAMILLFQGVNLLVERRTSASVVPVELRPAPAAASRWGNVLVGYAVLLVLAALFSHGYPGFRGAVRVMRNLGFALMAVYGLWLVFCRAVDYRPEAPAVESHGHGH